MTVHRDSLAVDLVIVGGGIAGLWLLHAARQAGYQALLLESTALGAGQTRYAQGIIHGGTKYALTGKLTASAEAVGRMPALWRACLQAQAAPDLSTVEVLSAYQYLWSTASLTSRLSGFFASKVMQSRTRVLDKTARPVLFQHPAFKGQVYRLDEPVLDSMSVIKALAEPQRNALLHLAADSLRLELDKTARLEFNTVDGRGWRLQAQRLILTAGQGNRGLLALGRREQPAMQLRPLKMVMLRGGLPEPLFAHCLDANVNPRLTITSHRDARGELVWYLGGQLAEDGVSRSDAEQIAAARAELVALLPWLDTAHSEWATLDIDRAEPQQAGGRRPDNAFAVQDGALLTAWPTKMALAPYLAEQVLQMLQQAGIEPGPAPDLAQDPADWPTPPYARLPWQEEARWK